MDGFGYLGGMLVEDGHSEVEVQHKREQMLG